MGRLANEGSGTATAFSSEWVGARGRTCGGTITIMPAGEKLIAGATWVVLAVLLFGKSFFVVPVGAVFTTDAALLVPVPLVMNLIIAAAI